VNPLYVQYSEPSDLQKELNQPFSYTGNNPVNRIDPYGLEWSGNMWTGFSPQQPGCDVVGEAPLNLNKNEYASKLFSV